MSGAIGTKYYVKEEKLNRIIINGFQVNLESIYVTLGQAMNNMIPRNCRLLCTHSLSTDTNRNIEFKMIKSSNHEPAEWSRPPKMQ